MDIFLRQEIFTRPSKFANFSPTRARWKTCRLAILPFIFHKNLWKSKFLEIFHKERKKIPGICSVDTNRPRKLLIRKIPFIYLSRGSEHELREQTNVIINSRVNEGSIHSIRCIFSTIFHYITIQSILENLLLRVSLRNRGKKARG